MSLTLRQPGLEDATVLSLLGLETFRETFVAGFALPYSTADLAMFEPATFGVGTISALLAAPENHWRLAELDGRAVGYALSGPCGLPHPDARRQDAELKRLYVRKAAQGLHVGRLLMDEAMEWMGQARPGPAWIGVWSGNLKAQRFYHRYGFEKVGEYFYPVGATRDYEFILRRG